MPSRSTTEAIHLLKRLMGLYRDRKVDLHIVFIDLEKAYDGIRVKCYGDAWKIKECHRCIFYLLRICIWEVGRVLGRWEGSQLTSLLVWGCIRAQP